MNRIKITTTYSKRQLVELAWRLWDAHIPYTGQTHITRIALGELNESLKKKGHGHSVDSLTDEEIEALYDALFSDAPSRVNEVAEKIRKRLKGDEQTIESSIEDALKILKGEEK